MQSLIGLRKVAQQKELAQQSIKHISFVSPNKLNNAPRTDSAVAFIGRAVRIICLT
jgi:hypothetical protein